MRRRIQALVGLAGLLALAASPLHAADGRIVFSGAVVEPTCGLPAAAGVPVPAAPGQAPARQLGCGADGRSAPTGQVFTQTVARLSASERIPVLRYFSDYVAAGEPGAERPLLVTQTYD
ncbi:hypothetical protein [Fulvimonas yonginensis]|uniref:Type 1 fimbrial protein n=1 Tax=Fulvimonas yonginensis TaxID=1495200 RepID=A0ABU8J7F2_9GAMM